jgi:Fe-Mn family superoxide dismutase
MFSLIQLPYSPDALEPVISAQTLSFHHGKHLQGYVDNLNKLLPGTGLEEKSLEEIIVISSGAEGGVEKSIFNNAGQILNHNLYFTQFRPASVISSDSSVILSEANESILRQIEKQWGSLGAFKEDFVAKGVSLFGSGWVWLSAAEDGSLVISQEPGASNPIIRGLKPLLTFDVWEHAYYLDYQNRRAAHLEALWGIVDWKVVERRYLPIIK